MTDDVERQLEAYFEGSLREFDLPLTCLGSPFQTSVREALQTIPCGETWSYSQLSKAMGRAGAVRAVGTANGANALAIVVPCHRVIGADGKLVGYGGKLWRKQRLLELEGAITPTAD